MKTKIYHPKIIQIMPPVIPVKAVFKNDNETEEEFDIVCWALVENIIEADPNDPEDYDLIVRDVIGMVPSFTGATLQLVEFDELPGFVNYLYGKADE